MKLLIVYYSMYGHVYKLADAAAEGARSIEYVEATLRRVPETLPKEVLEKMGAVEAVAQFEDLREGRVFVWMVAIINPDGPACVLAMSQVTSRAEAKKPNEVGQKGITVKALSTFKFIK